MHCFSCNYPVCVRYQRARGAEPGLNGRVNACARVSQLARPRRLSYLSASNKISKDESLNQTLVGAAARERKLTDSIRVSSHH